MTDFPVRVQRKRTKGWRMPPNTISVGRPGRFGNPFAVGDLIGPVHDCEPVRTRGQAVLLFSNPRRREQENYPTNDEIKASLKGYNLACWCPLDQPCHADILLEIANS